MLTLQELKQVVGNREERRKVPSARYLRENDVAVVKQRLIDGAEIIAYQTGYTPILFWILLAGAGMAGLGGTVILRKKKK